MSDLYTQIITVFLGFFAIMNPIANTAAFVGLVGEKESSEQFRVAAKAIVITFVVILAFSLLGKFIFQAFGISLPALRIAGGILVFIVGYHMLNGSGSKLHSAENSDEGDIAVSPLAMPLLAGPGTIATAMNYSATGGFTGIIVTVSVFFVLCLITFACFIFSSKILTVIGEGGMSIITRLMGLILTVIGVQLMLLGISTGFNIPILS
ncbi:MarC family protein [Thiomicrorhabdus sp.]|uniref:MarC family protein n=1 Tax=Thiomicrorhabdus sp. TaxID=2039724 RepID=UPI002AA65F96|nr:MarC family protein [Thiomicrorhabdus sp.]